MKNLFLFLLLFTSTLLLAKENATLKNQMLGTEEDLDQSWPKLGKKNEAIKISNETVKKNEVEVAEDNQAFEEDKLELAELAKSKSANEGDASILRKRKESSYRPRLNAHSAGLGLGQTFLRGDFQKSGEDQVTPDFYYAYTASYSFDVVGNLHYSKHREGQRSVTIMGAAAAIKSRLYNFDSLSPFVLGGLGFYRPTTSESSVDSEGKTVFGSNFGAGVDLRLNTQVTVGALMHYHNPFDVKNDHGANLEGSYYKLLLTLMYSF